MKNLTDLVSGVSNLTIPKMTRDVEIPVYMVHNSADPEDYFFLFDFEEFVDSSSQGIFARPVLRIYAGRDDFSRAVFARQFREVFASEFDRMRADLAQSKKRGGWLDWGGGVLNPFDLVGSLVANVVLAIALSVGRMTIGKLSLPRLLKGKDAEAKLRDEISATKTKVERALERVEITQHPELYEHAYRGGPKGKNAGMDRAAWPLPQHVRDHLCDQRSGAWW